eukprot:COSAG01_NODE_187_length_22645_cov_44.301565_17_plen_347_part_00
MIAFVGALVVQALQAPRSQLQAPHNMPRIMRARDKPDLLTAPIGCVVYFDRTQVDCTSFNVGYLVAPVSAGDTSVSLKDLDGKKRVIARKRHGKDEGGKELRDRPDSCPVSAVERVDHKTLAKKAWVKRWTAEWLVQCGETAVEEDGEEESHRAAAPQQRSQSSSRSSSWSSHRSRVAAAATAAAAADDDDDDRSETTTGRSRSRSPPARRTRGHRAAAPQHRRRRSPRRSRSRSPSPPPPELRGAPRRKCAAAPQQRSRSRSPPPPRPAEMKVAELKAALAERGLDVKGKKAELAARLAAAAAAAAAGGEVGPNLQFYRNQRRSASKGELIDHMHGAHAVAMSAC